MYCLFSSFILGFIKYYVIKVFYYQIFDYLLPTPAFQQWDSKHQITISESINIETTMGKVCVCRRNIQKESGLDR